MALALTAQHAVSAGADNEVKYSSGMTAVKVGHSDEGGICIKSGTYSAAGAKQMRITNSEGEVRLFKGQLPNNGSSVAEVRDGDVLEYSGTIYLTSITPERAGSSKKTGTDSETEPREMSEGRNAALGPVRYEPVKNVSMIQLLDGCCTVIDKGRITVYNRYGEVYTETYRSFASELSGYILNENVNSGMARGEEENPETVIELVSGQRYLTGGDVEEGAYEGTGSGIVRIYDPAGYPKTVIRLRRSGRSSEDGVEAYTFRLGENESIITEGSITFRSIDDTNR